MTVIITVYFVAQDPYNSMPCKQSNTSCPCYKGNEGQTMNVAKGIII